MAVYELARCVRCKMQLEPAPFGDLNNDQDWGHPTADGAQCWPANAAPPLFLVERIEIEVDESDNFVRLTTHEKE